jgi:ectoine hydroxylase-related dioxygenase (phytanoyl-CoA dioxygenase family)
MFKIEPSQVWRCIIFLEGWKSGHYFEINGAAHMNWRAGDYVLWNNDVPHFAGNFGLEPRYTMQITGTQK